MTPILRTAQKVQVFETRKRGSLFPTEAVVDGKAVVLGEDNRALVALDRANLSVLWRARVSGLSPMSWWGNDLLVLRGDTDVGVWDVNGRRLLWRAKGELGLGGNRWNHSILTWRTKNDIDLRDRNSGQVMSGITVPAPAVGFATLCEGLLVCRSVEKGDPFRAVSLDSGLVVWDRNLLSEIRSAYDVDEPDSSGLGVVPGTIAGRFVATRGTATFGCSLENGKILWKADVRVPYRWPLVEGGRVPVYSDLDCRFTVIDEATGEIVCDRRYPELRPMYHVKRGSIMEHLAIFVSESGHVAAFRLDNGDLVFLEQHKRVAFLGTAVADGRLLVSGSDGNLWVYEGAVRTR